MFGPLIVDDSLYRELKKLVGQSQLWLFNADGDFVEVIRKTEFRIRVPLGFFSGQDVDLRGITAPIGKNHMLDATNMTIPRLYPIQRQVITEIRRVIRDCHRDRRPIYMTLHLACGFGKTVIASYLACMHRRKTVICVPNKMLLSQWEKTISQLGVSYYISIDGVGKLMKDVLNDRDISILIVVNKHFTNDSFCELVYERYDMLILDESHTYNLMNLTAMTKFLSFYPPKLCYFLTATPRAVNRVYCNRTVNVLKSSSLSKTIRVINTFFPYTSNAKIREYVQRLDSPGNKYHIYTEKVLAEDGLRNSTIITVTTNAFIKGDINRVIVITKLRSHMFCLFSAIKDIVGDSVYLGDAQSKHASSIAQTLRELDRFIFISTLFYAGTGLDIPNLDALVVCHAVMNNMQMEQLLGRICRETVYTDRTVFVFPTTSIRDIKHTVGLFAQRFITLATQKLGFVQITDDRSNVSSQRICGATRTDVTHKSGLIPSRRAAICITSRNRVNALTRIRMPHN